MTLGNSIDGRREIFLCYAHENRDWVDKLELNKKPDSTESATLWIDTDQLYLGERWTLEAKQVLERATAAILLVSNDLLASSAIIQHELPIIMRRFVAREMIAVFVPIGKDLNLGEVAKTLDLDNVQDIEAVQSWLDPLPKMAVSRPLIREMIISAATEPKEIQRLRRNAPQYKIKKKIGDGPFSRVYTAYDHQLERDVAIKLLRDGCNGEHFGSAVRKVAKATDHTNILSVYSAYLDASPPYYAFEYVDGHPLHALNEEPLPVRYVRELLTSVGSAISYAHRRQISNLNIKPSNIIVTNHNSRPDRNYFLHINSYSELEFLENDSWRENRDDVLYLPPEYRRKVGTWPDPRRADQYRLGVVAYEMLLGSKRFRFVADALRQREFTSENWQWPEIKTERRDCPQRIRDVVDKMVRTDPRDRYGSAGDAVDSVTNTDPDIETVRESYRRLMETEESQIGFFKSFYMKFFDRYPEARRYFDRKRFGDLGEDGEISKGWERQFQALKEAILLLIVFNAFHEEKREINILTRIVEAHANRRVPVPAGLYRAFGKVLVKVAAEKDGDAPIGEEELRRAWKNVVRPGIKHMRRKTEEIEAERLAVKERTTGVTGVAATHEEARRSS